MIKLYNMWNKESRPRFSRHQGSYRSWTEFGVRMEATEAQDAPCPLCWNWFRTAGLSGRDWYPTPRQTGVLMGEQSCPSAGQWGSKSGRFGLHPSLSCTCHFGPASFGDCSHTLSPSKNKFLFTIALRETRLSEYPKRTETAGESPGASWLRA